MGEGSFQAVIHTEVDLHRSFVVMSGQQGGGRTRTCYCHGCQDARAHGLSNALTTEWIRRSGGIAYEENSASPGVVAGGRGADRYRPRQHSPGRFRLLTEYLLDMATFEQAVEGPLKNGTHGTAGGSSYTSR